MLSQQVALPHVLLPVFLAPGVYYNESIAPDYGNGGQFNRITYTAPEGAIFDHTGKSVGEEEQSRTSPTPSLLSHPLLLSLILLPSCSHLFSRAIFELDLLL